jgi:hypothetical protein
MQQRTVIAIMKCPVMLRCIMLSALCVAPFARAETLDRIAVSVGRHVISEQDILQDIRVSAFIDRRQTGFSPEQKRKAADRLIDQYLVLQDAALTRTPIPSTRDVAAILEPIKARYPSAQEYQSALSQSQITDAELTEHLLAGLQMLRYTDLRFRPEVQISDDALHAYYDKLTAETTNTSARPTFEASRGDIEKLLTEQQTMQALDRWLSTARTDKAIVYHEAAFK